MKKSKNPNNLLYTLDEIYLRYKRLGQVSLIPYLMMFAVVFYFFWLFYVVVLQKSLFQNDLNIDNILFVGQVLILFIFIFILSGILSGIISSIIYWINYSKQNEKWFRRAHNLRLYSWIWILFLGIGLISLSIPLVLGFF